MRVLLKPRVKHHMKWFSDNKPRSDFEMWEIISESGVEDEENLPINFANIFDECKFFISCILLERPSFFSKIM